MSVLRAPLGALVLLGAAALVGCAHLPPTGPTPEAADRPWLPPQPLPAAVTTPSVPVSPPAGDLAAAAAAALNGHELKDGKVDLPLAIDLALANSPRTRASWLGAKAAAAEVGVKRAQYYPDIALNGTLQHQQALAGNGSVTVQTTETPTVDLNWLLLDFGGRSGDVGEAKQLLLAANLGHNQAIQDVVLDVSQAFYRYISARALRDAERADLEGAQANLDAANQRHDAGLSTVADVLQAKTALAQAQLALQQTEGDMQVIRGALATAMGLPADLPVDAAPLDEEVPVAASSEAITTVLARALTERPELLAARARALAAEQRIRQERSAALPTVSLTTFGTRTYFNGDKDAANGYAGALLLHVPLFSGFEHKYAVDKARAEAGEAHANADSLENQVRLQVFTSYYDLQTAALRFHTSQDLLAAAEENARVAAGRYHEGVGSILDLLQAQSALAGARAQHVLTRADWLVSLAQLAHDTGALGPTSVPSVTTSAPAANTTPPIPR